MAPLRLPFGDIVPADLLSSGDGSEVPSGWLQQNPSRRQRDRSVPWMAVYGGDPNGPVLRDMVGASQSPGSGTDNQEGSGPIEKFEYGSQSIPHGPLDRPFNGWDALRIPCLDPGIGPKVSIADMARDVGLTYKDGKVG